MAECATTIDEARELIRASLEGIRRGDPPLDFAIADDVWEILEFSGELDAWEIEERSLWAAAGERDEAESEDDLVARFYSYGRDPYYLGTGANDEAEFLLGVPEPSWGWNGRSSGVVFVSARRLMRRRSPFPYFDVDVCIDSGGFTELHKFGEWRTTPEQYIALVRRVAASANVRWAAIQDWMVEESALAATGLTVVEHQRRTVVSYLRLRALAPEIRWLPVLQGQTLGQYLEHLEMYQEAGVYLDEIERVGVGSICRRTNSGEICEILTELATHGLRIHAFGVKSEALRVLAPVIRSSDSMSWSLRGRYITRTTGQRDSLGSALSNSQEFAERWRAQMSAYIREAAKDSRTHTQLRRMCVSALRSSTIPGVSRSQIEQFIQSRLDDILTSALEEGSCGNARGAVPVTGRTSCSSDCECKRPVA